MPTALTAPIAAGHRPPTRGGRAPSCDNVVREGHSAQALRGALRESRLIGIVRGRDADAAFRTVLTLVEHGLDLVEVSLSGADALDVIHRARQALGVRAWLGAGAVTTAGDVHRAADAGANFIVTTGAGTALTEAVRRRVPVLAGASTPEEIRRADTAGATALRVVPGSVGGASYLRSLRGRFPRLCLVPSGAATAAEAAAFLDAGACAVGAGRILTGDAADGGDLHALRSQVARFRAECAA
ncbi:bifunctional 4-hydroxy-2-oxoglutarate aldolase/2-dehydro-3-deoxy-phosphogluconate aldolase [Streptomyces bambusae]|uniref:bifunctional 4-hydroxy-2-oxoglutarate aldolase/2-dehydro-3-deoxy-phosphogluconate aldolase n=1 Tax=Streptomyces bambusae TaxID=1550616 RepID=UPI001CFC6D53|nr:bifunctional 4-hydroxy-2-oxoglutarate aldolase/2-dehydro-3-deoxy-phosphogluconate aldolase [Streptomyces bambusae]MCB5169054.1 bifunctional 4-hydroxy-2-oxoglutarate aldolase/2-dehydro-3-deoxy-phosphogluconate aldolase [Streptomyces bambusae]